MTDDSSNFTKYFSDSAVLDGVAKKYNNYISNGVVPDHSAENKPIDKQVGGLPAIINGKDFPAKYDLKPREFLVDGMFQRGDNILVTAPSKLGKSFFWANAAISISAGVPFLGKSTTKSNVLILDLELRKEVAQDRLISIALARGFDQVPEGLWLWSLAKHCYDLETICEALNAQLMHLPKIDLIVVDPLYVLDRGDSFDENNAHCVTRLMTALEKLTVQTGAALGLSHHYRKGNLNSQDSIDRGAGSGAFSRYPDVIMSLSKHELEDCVIAESTTRNMKSPSPFVFQLDAPLVKVRSELDATRYRKYGQPGIAETEVA